jgi:membrane-anchored protein YejM (alkaline phosphatase superfamily)
VQDLSNKHKKTEFIANQQSDEPYGALIKLNFEEAVAQQSVDQNHRRPRRW